MGKVKLIVALALLVLIVSTIWQVASWEVAYIELQDDLIDIAALNSARIGLDAPSSDDDLRDTVVRKAKEHGIQLQPKQVTVVRSGTPEAPRVSLAASYRVRVSLPGYTFTVPFKPTSRKGM